MGTLRLANIIHFKLFIHMNLSEALHVTNQVRQGGVLSPRLFAVYIVDD